MNIIDVMVAIQLLIAFPIGVYVFARRKVTWEGILAMCDKYRYHFYMLFAVFILKTSIFFLEVPVEGRIGINFTPMVHALEGNTIFWVQHYLQNDYMTLFMAIIYIGSFLFIVTFSLALFSYIDKRMLASKLALLNMILLFLTIPFYFFVIVYVPSYPKMFYPDAQSVIRGMEPLLYNFGPHINEFFMGYETFNNCFPSMHIGFPSAILMTIIWNVRGYRGYKIFLFVMIWLIALSIVYLGIHWLSDIAGGLLIALLAVLINEKYSRRFWKWMSQFDKRRRHREREKAQLLE